MTSIKNTLVTAITSASVLASCNHPSSPIINQTRAKIDTITESATQANSIKASVVFKYPFNSRLEVGLRNKEVRTYKIKNISLEENQIVKKTTIQLSTNSTVPQPLLNDTRLMFVSQNGEILTTAPLKESISEMHLVRPYLIPIGVSHNFSLLVETISSDFSKYYKDTSFTITFTLEGADSHKETIITVDDSATE